MQAQPAHRGKRVQCPRCGRPVLVPAQDPITAEIVDDRRLLVEHIFDPRQGWDYDPDLVPVTRSAAVDGNPLFTVNVDGIFISVWQVTRWKEGHESNVSPWRLICKCWLTGYTMTDATAFLTDNHAMCGLPCFGLDSDGTITLQSAFPISRTFPVGLARKLMLTSLGLIAHNANNMIQAWSGNRAPASAPQGSGGPGFSWEAAGKVAKVAGMFLGALFD
jgi:hypothetical protein